MLRTALVPVRARLTHRFLLVGTPDESIWEFCRCQHFTQAVVIAGVGLGAVHSSFLVRRLPPLLSAGLDRQLQDFPGTPHIALRNPMINPVMTPPTMPIQAEPMMLPIIAPTIPMITTYNST